MRYRVEHVTRITYRSAIRLARFNLRLDPVAWPGQTVEDFALAIEPSPSLSLRRQGPYPVTVTRVEIDQPIDELKIRASFHATAQDAMLDLASPDLAIAAVARAALERGDLGSWAPAHYLYPSPLLPGTPEIAAWARPLLPAEAPALAGALALARLIYTDFRYDPKATEADTPVAHAFAIRRGCARTSPTS